MLVQGSTLPKKIEIRKTLNNTKTFDNTVTLKLRNNIIEKIKKEENSTINYWEYEEVEITISNRENLIDSVNKDFLKWFDFGLKQEMKREEEKRTTFEINKLIKDKELVPFVNNTEMLTMLTTLLMGEIDTLKTRIEKLEGGKVI